MALYTPVMRTNLSLQIADNLENLIVSQKLEVGDRLPGEIELAEQFGISRNILREAITILKERGLIQVRNGSGAYVAQPDPQLLGNVIGRLISVGSTKVQEVYELRVAIEVKACGLAAENITADELETLKTVLNDMERDYRSHSLWTKHDYLFHEIIATATHNSLFPEFQRQLMDIVIHLSDQNPRTLEARKNGIEQHRRILQAIADHDRSAAEKAMFDHLDKFRTDLTGEAASAGGT